LKEALKEDTAVAQAILVAGAQWTGSGWSITSAGGALHDLTGIAIVGNFELYRDIWLWCCALVWDVDLKDANLPEQHATAAFTLSGVCGRRSWAEQMEEGEEEEEEVEEVTSFPWEAPLQRTPADLATIWRRFGSGQDHLDVRGMLENVPRYSCIPLKPPGNNFRGDARSPADKSLKAAQQSLLNTARLQALTYEAFGKLAATVDTPKVRFVATLLQHQAAYTAWQC
jgi:hypothetical protein